MDAIAEMIGAIISLIVSSALFILGAIAELLWMLVESIFKLFGTPRTVANKAPDASPAKSLPRAQTNPAAAAKAPDNQTKSRLSKYKPALTGLLLTFIVGGWIYDAQQKRWNQARADKTRIQIAKLADHYIDQLKQKQSLDETKRLLNEADAWDRNFELFIDRGIWGKMIVVRSHGSDGQPGTIDDLLAIRVMPSTAGKISKMLADMGIEFAKGRLLKLLPEKSNIVIPIEIDFYNDQAARP
ncbi:MAG: hypothetical protein WAO83_01665 [Fuerstiella sp.]|jgi:fumarylacetoacetate (FAA) hydrolase family protein